MKFHIATKWPPILYLSFDCFTVCFTVEIFKSMFFHHTVKESPATSGKRQGSINISRSATMVTVSGRIHIVLLYLTYLWSEYIA